MSIIRDPSTPIYSESKSSWISFKQKPDQTRPSSPTWPLILTLNYQKYKCWIRTVYFVLCYHSLFWNISKLIFCVILSFPLQECLIKVLLLLNLKVKPLNINIWNSFKVDLIFTDGMEYKKQSSQHCDSHDSSEHFLKFAPWSKILSYRRLGHFPMKTFGSRDNEPAQIRSIGENILS